MRCSPPAPGPAGTRRPPSRLRIQGVGFTLIELCVALAIGLVFFIGLFILWNSGTRMFRKTEANLEAIESSAMIMTIIEEDMRRLTLTRKMLVGGPQPAGTGFPGKDQYKFIVTFTDDTLQHVDAGNSAQKGRVVLGENKTADHFLLPIGMDDPTKYQLIEYQLQPYVTNPPSFKFVRTIQGFKSHTYGSLFIRQLAFIMRGAKRDKSLNQPVPAAWTPGNAMDAYWLQVVVVGISTTLQEPAFKDYYRAPLVDLFALDALNARLTKETHADVWNEDKDVPAAP